jgi:phosphopantetheine--protein transferase-like protein
MEDKIKNILSPFIRVPAEQIAYETVIDRTSVSSSITLHRMYAKLAEEGIAVADYWNIKTYGKLLERINYNGNANAAGSNEQALAISYTNLPTGNGTTAPGVGIDIEDVDAMPRATDFREDEFYKMNFSANEIAYCILQPQPYASFAGLFAAKEAIVKANNANRSRPFNTIIINHNEEGKPVCPGFNLSVSHTNNIAVAVAIQMDNAAANNEPHQQETPPQKKGSSWLLIISFLISIVALLLAIIK